MSRKRSRARSRAVQAIYQWQMTGQEIGEICEQFVADHPMNGVDVDYFRELVHGVVQHHHSLDDELTPCLDRDLQLVDPVERAILRLGTWELLRRPDIPYRVVIDEAVELAKSFGGEAGHKFVNGVLDKVASRLRDAEVKKRGGKGNG